MRCYLTGGTCTEYCAGGILDHRHENIPYLKMPASAHAALVICTLPAPPVLAWGSLCAACMVEIGRVPDISLAITPDDSNLSPGVNLKSNSLQFRCN